MARSERFPLLLLQLLLLARGAKPIEAAEYMDGQRWKGYANPDVSSWRGGAYSVSHTRLAQLVVVVVVNLDDVPALVVDH